MCLRVYLSPLSLLEEQGHQLRSQSELSCQFMAFQVGRRGRGGRRLIENVKVMRLMQRLDARLDVIGGERQRDPNDVSEDE